jgi:L-glyceraldehyde 3-phosphate reductase
VAQLEENLAAIRHPGFSESELAAIDRYAAEGHLNIWASSSEVPSA